MQIIRVETRDKLIEAARAVAATPVIGLDIETTDLDPRKGRIRLIQLAVGDVVYVIDCFRFSRDELLFVWTLCCSAQIKICHNGKFDLKWIMYHLGNEWDIPQFFFDTMLSSQLVHGGDKTARHGLEAAARIFAGIVLDKDEQKSDWVGELSDRQITYAARDSHSLFPLRDALMRRLRAEDLMRAATIEFECLPALADMELAGFHMEQDRWSELLVQKIVQRDIHHRELLDMMQAGVNWKVKNPERVGTRPVKPKRPVNPRLSKSVNFKSLSTTEQLELLRRYDAAMEGYDAARVIHERAMRAWEALPLEVVPQINLNSHIQVKDALANLGIRLPIDRKTGLPSTREHEILPLADDYPVVAKLLEYRGWEKSVTSYGQTFLDSQDEHGRIRSDFHQIGAPTGRMSSRDPNLQQVPHDEAHRRCFTAPPGRKLVVADFSQVELRILAEFSGDANFCYAFNSGLDLHRHGASSIFGTPYDEVTKEQRDFTKRLNFGIVYGIGAKRFSKQTGISVDEADDIIRKYLRTYPGNDRWLTVAAEQAKHMGFARSASGRIQRLYFDPADKGQVGFAGRNGRNMPVQGTSSDITKVAVAKIWKVFRKERLDAKLVNVVHDETVTDSAENIAERVAKIVEREMVAAGEMFIHRVPVLVETHIGTEWLK